MHGSRGCLGCCTKPPLIISVDEPSKGLKIQGQRVKRHNISEDFWSSSSYEMNNSAFPSQRSVSSFSNSTQNLDALGNCGSSSSSNPQEYVNHGLLLWNQTRHQWIGDKGSKRHKKVEEPRLKWGLKLSSCWNASYESLLGTSKPFAQPIPLPEMVDFLVDVWEREGLYD